MMLYLVIVAVIPVLCRLLYIGADSGEAYAQYSARLAERMLTSRRLAVGSNTYTERDMHFAPDD